MIQKILIKNFKSIKDLEFEAKRINLFIGKPNTGKSNILESLGIFSLPYVIGNIRELVRFEKIIDIFYDNQTSLKIEVITNGFHWEAFSEENIVKLKEVGSHLFDCCFDIYGTFQTGSHPRVQSPFKFYRFKNLSRFPKKEFAFLLPPSGENLLTILATQQEIYNLVNSLMQEFKLEMALDEPESQIRILKPGPPKPILYSYSNLSDTLQRTIFYLTAIKSNRNSILLFEEPEAHAFPYYTKVLAECIALDTSGNQYFISTHNPYFLISVLETAPENEVTVFYTEFKEYQTKIVELGKEIKEEILQKSIDIFFQLDELTK